MADADSCSRHPDVAATSACSVCGSGLCEACVRVDVDEILCASCAAPRAGPAPPAELHAHADNCLPVAPHLDQPPPPPPRHPAVRLPFALFALLAAQTLATLFLGIHLGRLTDRLDQRPPPAATASMPGPRPPTLEPLSATVAPGTTIAFHGEAPDGDLVALLVNDHVIAVDLLRGARFQFAGIELGPGTYRVAVRAFRQTGEATRSSEITVTVAPPSTATPASVSSLTTPGPTRTPRPTPTPRASATESPLPSPRDASSPRGSAKNVSRGTMTRHMALTFDGGSNATQATTVLDALRDRSVKSTLFLTGDFIKAYPEVTRRALAEGHEIANHTLDHPHLCDWKNSRGHVTRDGVTRAFLLFQLNETRQLYEATTGAKMARLWRAPYGEFNRDILEWAAADGWTHIGWTDGFDTLDWVADRNDKLYRSATQIRDKLLRLAREGDHARGGIVLMHLGAEREQDAAAEQLPSIIDGLRGEGYKLVTVSKILSDG